MQGDIHVTPNKVRISKTVRHSNGKLVSVDIAPGKALIDGEGVVRFFSMMYDDGDVQAYKLHPYHTATEKSILWCIDFLAGYGLSRVGSKLVKPSPGVPLQQAEAIHMARYFTFSNPVGQHIRSYISRSVLSEHLGYHNILSDKLIFDGSITAS